MIVFFYEFLHFLAASLAILVSISSAALFIITFRYERKLQTGWRAIGFITLAMAFFLFILERKWPSLEIAAVLVEAFALFSIFKGVYAEPKLIHLEKTSAPPPLAAKGVAEGFGHEGKKRRSLLSQTLIGIVVFLLIAFILLLPGYLYIKPVLPSFLEAVAVAFIVATMVVQVRRYKADPKKINLYPLVGFIFLLIRGLALIFYRLPELNIVFLRKLTLEYSVVWIIAVLAALGAFAYLARWAWTFIKVRVFLRTYVVFISVVILVATIGSLIFTFFIYKILENNNLDLMLKGAETESVIMNDRSNTAMFVGRVMAKDKQLVEAIRTNNYQTISALTEDYLDKADIDILRVYNVFGEIIASPSDPRDRGKVLANDHLIAFAIKDKKLVYSFDVYPGVLADFIVTRAVYPLILNDAVIGALEVGYKFDNAFVDFSKEQTNLDVTVYTGSKISATTIKTLDEVSRYVGSVETSNDILEKVLKNGQDYTTVINRFDEIYYVAFKPVRNVNGDIIGMISVGTPTFLLRESMRQQLLTTFILVSLMSVLLSYLGYYVIPRLQPGVKK